MSRRRKPPSRNPSTVGLSQNVADKPPWLRGYPPLRQGQIDNLDKNFRKRAQAVEAIDDLLARLEERLQANGQLANTYVFFSSDNGYHMGEHRLHPGKQTAFDTDIRVPLIVTGPGVPAGKKLSEITPDRALRSRV